MKLQRFAGIALSSIVLFITCLALVSCLGTSSSPPDGYLSTSANNAYFIQFTEKNNQMNGHIQGIEETSTVPPQTTSSTTTFTGVQNGSSVTITTSAFGFSSSIVGTLNGNTLTLDVPQQDGHLQTVTFTGASLQQYNQAVDALQRKVSQQDQQYSNDQATATTLQYDNQGTASAVQATQTTQQQEQQAVSDANSQLASALSSLKSDESSLSSFSETSTLNGYANDWQTMQKDYATEQQDANAGCGTNSYNYSQVSYEASQVDYDKSQIDYEDSQFAYDKNQYNSVLTPVQNDVQAVNQDWTQLQQAVANNPTNTPAAAYTSSDVNNALMNAKKAEQTAQGVWQTAQSSVTQYDQEASTLQQKADALPASMHCS